jgi:hypothetical protein
MILVSTLNLIPNMKAKTILAAVLLSFAALLCFAAATTFTEGPATLWRVQSDPVFNGNGTLTNGNATFFFRSTYTNSGNASDTFTKELGSVNVDFVANGSNHTVTLTGQTITVNGVQSTNATVVLRYDTIATGLLTAGQTEWATANP